MESWKILFFMFTCFAVSESKLEETWKLCGRKAVDYERIPDSKHTVPGEIPWQARLFNKYQHDEGAEPHPFCGGALVEDDWVLTAAHCFAFDAVTRAPKLDYLTVQIGDPRTDDAFISLIKEIKIYPGYEHGKLKGDVALVRLATSAAGRKNLRPVCLPELDEEFRGSGDCFASGWGHFSGTILVETGTVMQQEQLEEEWDGPIYDKIWDTNIGFSKNSTTDENNNFDVGGPVVCRRPYSGASGMKSGWAGWQLVGVVVAGTNFGEKRSLVMAEVAKFAEWIRRSMKLEEPIKTCGVQPPTNKKLVVGGHDTVPGEIPWQMAIVHEYAHIKNPKEPKTRTCGATLIRKNWVLTASHCFDLGKGKLTTNATYWQVRGGDWQRDVVDEKEVDIDVEKIIGHPGYKSSLLGVENDIALLKLKAPFDIKDSFQSVAETGIGLACLPQPNADYRERGQCMLSGFGQIWKKEDNKEGKKKLIPVRAKLMQQVSGKTWNQKKLKKAWNPLGGLIKLVTGDMIGFGMDRNGNGPFGDDPYGACSGDSGGPLVCPSMSGNPPDWPYLWPQMTVVGVVSFGDPKCTTRPSVFTEVSKYWGWIHTTIMEDEFKGVKMPDYERKTKE